MSHEAIDKSHPDYRLAETISLQMFDGAEFTPNGGSRPDQLLLEYIPEIRARSAAERPGVEVELTELDLNTLDRAYLDGVSGDHATTSDAWRSGAKAVVTKFLELRTLPPKPEQGGAVPRVDAAKLSDAAREQIADDAEAVFNKHVVNVREIADYVIGQTLLRVMDATAAVQVYRTSERKPTGADGKSLIAFYQGAGCWCAASWSSVSGSPKDWTHWMYPPPAPEPELSAEEKAFEAWIANHEDTFGTSVTSAMKEAYIAGANFKQEAKASV